jgi:hypothetical protein
MVQYAYRSKLPIAVQRADVSGCMPLGLRFLLPESNRRVLQIMICSLQEVFGLVWVRFVMRSTLLAALRFEEEYLLTHCHFVSPGPFHHGCRELSADRDCYPPDSGSHVRELKVRCAWRGGRKKRMRRTNWVVFEHAQRLMRSWPLHCSVVARHGH